VRRFIFYSVGFLVLAALVLAGRRIWLHYISVSVKVLEQSTVGTYGGYTVLSTLVTHDKQFMGLEEYRLVVVDAAGEPMVTCRMKAVFQEGLDVLSKPDALPNGWRFHWRKSTIDVTPPDITTVVSKADEGLLLVERKRK
jgi:hypothetical protein